jgi:hypothetical protein
MMIEQFHTSPAWRHLQSLYPWLWMCTGVTIWLPTGKGSQNGKFFKWQQNPHVCPSYYLCFEFVYSSQIILTPPHQLFLGYSYGTIAVILQSLL